VNRQDRELERIERIETPRMILERLRPEHADEAGALLSDPLVARTLFAASHPPSETQLLESHAAKLAHWDKFGFGIWLLRDKDTGEMVGRGGLQHTTVAGAAEIEVGWAITPQRWGQGLATELAQASIAVAFDDLGLREIVAFTLPGNGASRRVMEKSGFEYEGPVVHAGLPHVLYRRWPPA
jgi:ribosomal-protein-alanine N-acetyltransferase